MLATPLYIPAEKPEMLDSLDKKDEKIGKTSTVYGINIFVCAYCSKAFYPRQYTKKPAFQPESGRYFFNGVFLRCTNTEKNVFRYQSKNADEETQNITSYIVVDCWRSVNGYSHFFYINHNRTLETASMPLLKQFGAWIGNYSNYFARLL